MAAKKGGYGEDTPFEGDLEEREAIQAIDGEVALCVHCGEFVGIEEEPIPVAGGRVLHGRCYADWYETRFGKKPANGPEGGRT